MWPTLGPNWFTLSELLREGRGGHLSSKINQLCSSWGVQFSILSFSRQGVPQCKYLARRSGSVVISRARTLRGTHGRSNAACQFFEKTGRLGSGWRRPKQNSPSRGGENRQFSSNRHGRKSAIHHNILPRDERRSPRRGEPDDSAGELVGFAETAHRRVADDLAAPFGIGSVRLE
jgi:hypothetical protein